MKVFGVFDRRTGKELDGLPTPRLIEAHSGEAWMRDESIWRLREPDDPPETVYRQVIIRRLPDPYPDPFER